MSNYQEYTDELNELNKQFKIQNPSDILQFCFNHFNNRLINQRNLLFQQKEKLESNGFNPFPSLKETLSNSNNDRSDIPLFKTPFADNDPHTIHSHHHHHEDDDKNPNDPSTPSFGSSFKNFTPGSGFAVGLSKTSPIMNFNANRRTSVSAEALNPDTFGDDDWKPPVHQFNQEQLKRLNASVVKNFLFSQLDEESLKTIIFALEEKRVLKGIEIIKQGDEGDFFYIVESGIVDFYVNGQKVNTSGSGSSFGELALMYNSPRAATAIAETDCILWALDRMTFRRILLEGTSKKRSIYENFLKEVPVLKSLSSYERSKLADALNTESYQIGENVVSEGEDGENFYFIEDGSADVLKNGLIIKKLNKGDYFGELALLHDSPRQATVKATSYLKVVSLGKSGFQRLLGPAVEVLKLQDPTKN
ncbi:hypothetical protein CANARDRAFT_236817 [[Candida] arabinofermentans NRRL YB-2248]|uniref:cAMP-dependent protein kinase regulatory subunit n=1 Tax=[Candida] arabinofermentans NRRL YB-2248 TaxID=983967 RepID=A0A1E4SWZ3_9ASCO|nr:hypothetical protein CANARDRAFT_236817 [[Candida] arabinofermentans NRRL YB-2248]